MVRHAKKHLFSLWHVASWPRFLRTYGWHLLTRKAIFTHRQAGMQLCSRQLWHRRHIRPHQLRRAEGKVARFLHLPVGVRTTQGGAGSLLDGTECGPCRLLDLGEEPRPFRMRWCTHLGVRAHRHAQQHGVHGLLLQFRRVRTVALTTIVFRYV